MRCVKYSGSYDDFSVLTVSADKTARVWDSETAEALFALVGHTDKLTQAQWSGDDSLIMTASDDGTVRIWDAWEEAPPAGELPDLTRHFGRISRMALNADGDRLLTAGLYDQMVQIVDLSSSGVLTTLEGHSDLLTDARWNQREDLVLTAGTDRTARIWDAENRRRIVASRSGERPDLHRTLESR